jgi:hypothetical protein
MNQINLEAYYKTIKKKTGKTPADFKELAINKGYVENGVLKPSVKATEVIAWLKADFGLGHGHGLALYHSFKDADNQ